MPSAETEILASAGRLLLEYNESTAEIYRALTATAKQLTDQNVDVAVKYGGVVVRLGDDSPVFRPVPELRYNARLQARVHAILNNLQCAKIEPCAGLELLNLAEANSQPHSRWLMAVLLGAAAASLAVLLGADSGATIIAGLGTSAGLVARQELARRHIALLALPLTAAFVGAVLSGLAIRLGWTSTPALALIVPSLMLIPGPHLINGLLDLIDNYLTMSVARFTLAAGIVVASALGIVLGIELTLSEPPRAEPSVNSGQLSLVADMLLAGMVTCGFAVYYNAAWSHVGMAAVGGMAGHGLRYLALGAGSRLEVATFLGSIAVGVIAALIARSYRIPLAVIAFAGAVTMMPGVQIYRALGGFLQLARLRSATELSTIAGTLGDASQAFLVVGSIALGLIVAARAVQIWTAERHLGSMPKRSI